jgi:hypothetical protein
MLLLVFFRTYLSWLKPSGLRPGRKTQYKSCSRLHGSLIIFCFLLHYLQRNGQKATVKKTTNVDFCTILFAIWGNLSLVVMLKMHHFYIYPSAIAALKINLSAISRRISLLFPKIQHCLCRVPIPTLVDWSIAFCAIIWISDSILEY